MQHSVFNILGKLRKYEKSAIIFMMKSFSAIILVLLLLVVVSLPFSVSAATSPGIKPGSFFYFFDTAFEKIGLFFTFNPEKKARKALEYADERLAEAEAVAGDDNLEAVKTAVTNYESNMAFAAEKAKDVGDKEKAKALLTSIADNTSKHQEVLTAVLVKVPDEAKEAIIRAIEASRRGQAEAIKKIVELKGEVEQLKQEVTDLKVKDEEREKMIEELSRRKPQSTSTPAFMPVQSYTSKTSEITPALKSEATKAPTKTDEPQVTPLVNQTQDNNTSATTLPPSPTPLPVTPPPATHQIEALEITSAGAVPDVISARIEWQTNNPTESKLYLSGGGLTSKLFASEAGYATKHFASINQLTPMTDYSFQITAIGNAGFESFWGSFKTKTPPPTIKFNQISQNVSLGVQGFKISWISGYVDSCSAFGAWSGSKPINGEEILSFNQAGDYTHTLTCAGKNGESVSGSIVITVLEMQPTIKVSLSPTNPLGKNIAKGEKGVTVLGLDIESNNENVKINNLKIKLVGTSFSNLQDLKVKVGGQLYSVESTDGDIKIYVLNYTLSQLSIQVLVQADIAPTANSDSFHVEIIEVWRINTVTGESAKTSDVITGNTFTIY
ncbi:MAG: hypothetical protein UX07_C0010G0011 [Parcubacteria group bacterium GW2011_GWA2_45_30]|nr:MAG: hypothetical protein UX07_C0010G0011 [Parcubacteria group bacterium GW2011_GWA2_45_30]